MEKRGGQKGVGRMSQEGGGIGGSDTSHTFPPSGHNSHDTSAHRLVTPVCVCNRI